MGYKYNIYCAFCIKIKLFLHFNYTLYAYEIEQSSIPDSFCIKYFEVLILYTPDTLSVCAQDKLKFLNIPTDNIRDLYTLFEYL